MYEQTNPNNDITSIDRVTLMHHPMTQVFKCNTESFSVNPKHIKSVSILMKSFEGQI